MIPSSGCWYARYRESVAYLSQMDTTGVEEPENVYRNVEGWDDDGNALVVDASVGRLVRADSLPHFREIRARSATGYRQEWDP